MENKQNAFLETEPLGRLMRKYSAPCVISLLVAALYNIVDQIFIANASDLGSFGNAANSVVFPLTVFALAIAVMIGDGCCAFVSLCLGAGKSEDAHKSIGSSVVLSLLAGLMLTAVYLLLPDGLLSLFGGRVNEQTFALSKEYFFCIALGIPFYVFGQAMNPVIRSDGSPKFAMVSTLAGAVVNLILDPVLIYGFHMGMTGAAVATVLGQVLTAALAVWYLCHMKAVRLEKASFRLHGKLMGQYLPLGVCSFLAQVSLVAAMAAVNTMIQLYGARDAVFGQPEYSQIPMAVVGIVMKFFQIAISVAIGLAAGCIPVAGYNMGAGQNARVRRLFDLLILWELLVGFAALLIVECFPLQLIQIFGAANESPHYTRFAVRCFRIYLCMLPLACLNKGVFIYLQALGQAVSSTLLSTARELVFGVGLALLLPRFLALDGVLFSMPAADVLTFVLSAAVIVHTRRKLSKNANSSF